MTEFPESALYICDPKLNTACSACVNGECCSSCCYCTAEPQYARTNDDGDPYLIAHSKDDYEQLKQYGDKVFSKVTGAAFVVINKDSEGASNEITLLDLTNLKNTTVSVDCFRTYFE